MTSAREQRLADVIDLQKRAGGASEGYITHLHTGRFELVPAGPNPVEFGFIGSDPYGTNVSTGLVVPTTPTSRLGGRYLMQLARARFDTGEAGVRLVGIRQYAELVAKLSPTEEFPDQFGYFRKEIVSPLWHPPDGDISWHVMIIDRVQRDSRNPLNTDGLTFEDSTAPTILYETFAGTIVTPTTYTPPNGGRPWGTPIGDSLGNIHDLRFNWRREPTQYALDIPIPVPCDVALFVSVRQNDPSTNPPVPQDDCGIMFSALSPEDQFLTAFAAVAQYGTVAGALVFEENL